MYNKGYQIAYIIKNICFIYFKSNYKIIGNWQKRYQDGNQINYSATNILIIKDFLFGKNNLKY